MKACSWWLLTDVWRKQLEKIKSLFDVHENDRKDIPSNRAACGRTLNSLAKEHQKLNG